MGSSKAHKVTKGDKAVELALNDAVSPLMAKYESLKPLAERSVPEPVDNNSDTVVTTGYRRRLRQERENAAAQRGKVNDPHCSLGLGICIAHWL